MRLFLGVHGYVGGEVPLRAGAEFTVHEAMRYLVDRGHQVDVGIVGGGPKSIDGYTIDGVRVLPRAEVHNAMWGRKYDVYSSHLDAARVVLYCAHNKKPTILFEHNHHWESIRLARKFLSPHHERLIVMNSNWMKSAYLASSLGQGIELESTLTVLNPRVRVSDYRVKPGGHVTLVNLTYEKGSLLLAELSKRMPDVKFLAVTGAYGEQEIDALTGLPNVKIIPTSGNMRDVYSQTRVLMVGSRYESWGRVAVEAAASGIPVVSTPMPGPLEALGDAGVFVDYDDTDGWERALRRLLTQRSHWKERSDATRARALDLESLSKLQLSKFHDLAVGLVSSPLREVKVTA